MPRPFDRIFISQAVLEEWSVGEMLMLDNENVATLTPSGWRFRLEPAMHITSCATETDSRGLVGQVKREAALREDGADVTMGSVIWGDDVYECTPGFIGERVDGPAGPPGGDEIAALNDAFLGNA